MSGFLIASFVIIVVALAIWLIWGNGLDTFTKLSGSDASFGDRISQTTSLSSIFGLDSDSPFRAIDYIFGDVPQYLIERTSGGSGGNGISAAIIIIGLWFLLFLSFADIVRLFGTFNAVTSWISAALLAIIAANLKFVMFVGVFALSITAGLGAVSVFAGLILAFVLFLGVQFGSEKLRDFAEKKKRSEMRIRAAMGSTKAVEGLKGLKEIGEELGS